jgi:ABC-type molybdate transport system ATPase subunit
VLSTVRNALLHNVGLKLFSLALAVAAWAYFRYTPAHGIAARFDDTINVPIVVTGLRPGFVASYTDKFVVMTVDTPRNGQQISRDQIKAVLNLAKNDANVEGVFNVPVEIVAPHFQIRSLSPASVTLTIDRLEERVVPISTTFAGDQRSVVVDSSRVTPATVTLRGTATDLARVQGVHVDIALPAKATALDSMIRPVAADARGGELSSIAVSPNLVRVRVKFVSSTASKAK